MNNRPYNKGLAIVLIITFIIMAALGIKLSGKEEEIAFNDSENSVDISNGETEGKVEEEVSKEYIFVDIDGQVMKPGVYMFESGDRVNDAIAMAGGLMDTAYTKNLNKARKLSDGEKIYIPSEDEAEISSESFDGADSRGSSNNYGLININTASVNELMSLPGIGQAYAQRIIDYRSSSPFSAIEEIKNVSGIGEKTFEKLKDLITIN